MTNQRQIQSITIYELLCVQGHIGSKQVSLNKMISSLLFGSRHGVSFFDLKKTLPFTKRALSFIKKATVNHSVILLIGSHTLIIVLVRYLAVNTSHYSISNKWVGGTLTNWILIKKYVKFLYTTTIAQIRKKFILRTEKKIEQKIMQYLKMKDLFFGIEAMPSLPSIVVVLDKEEDTYSIKEAKRLMIPIVSITNSNESGVGMTYPIFGNDNVFDTLFFYSHLIYLMIKEGLNKKRLFFFKQNPDFFNLLKKNKVLGKKYSNKLRFFHNNRRSYKTYSSKRLLRKYSYKYYSFSSVKTSKKKKQSY